jgi:hypothetical protein
MKSDKVKAEMYVIRSPPQLLSLHGRLTLNARGKTLFAVDIESKNRLSNISAHV